jgi:hypothetical protein
MWSSLEAFMLSHALDTHQTLDQLKDREWIHLLLSFFKSYVETRGERLLIHEEDRALYVSKLVDALSDAAGTLDTGTLTSI